MPTSLTVKWEGSKLTVGELKDILARFDEAGVPPEAAVSIHVSPGDRPGEAPWVTLSATNSPSRGWLS